MLRAYRLLYPDSPHAPPTLWEWQQPYIDQLILNARSFKTTIVVQCFFRHWDDLDQANTTIWQEHYRPCPLYDDIESWKGWLERYRQIILDVQDIYDKQFQ